MHRIIWSAAITLLVLQSCIKDDILFDTIDPVLRITSLIDTLEINTSYQFETAYFDNVGQEQDVELTWESSDESVLTVTNTGLAQAVSAGNATVIARFSSENVDVSDEINISVGESTVITNDQLSGSIRTTSTYALSGEFTVDQVGANVVIDIADGYVASTALPGLYVYLSNNQNSINGALEIGRVSVFSGAHQYSIDNIEASDYRFIVYFCKPFNIKVGDGEIK